MKKLNIILISLIVALGFISCEKDEIITINPAAEEGTISYVLHNAKYTNFTYLLDEANSGEDMGALYTQQPDYGFNAAVTYYIQVSFTEDMKDFVELATSVQGEKVTIVTKDMAKAMFDLYKGAMPRPAVAKDVFVRLRAVASNATKTPLITEPTVKPLYSNVVKLSVMPYYIPPIVHYWEAKVLRPYYIIGYTGWSNDKASLGKEVIPLSVVPDKVYNDEGDGIWTFTGYFEAAKEFKLIRDLGGWNEQWGNKGANGINNPISKAIAGEEPSNFQVPKDGYYTITLNSIKHELKIEETAITPAVYTSMGLVGEFNAWEGDLAMTKYDTTSSNNHVWYKEVTFTIDNNYLFRANGNWDLKFGAPTSIKGDPAYQFVGLGVLGGGSDILETAGTYVMIINDIDGCYWAIKK